MKKVIVTYGQVMLDVAIQEYGCIEGLFVLAEDNDLQITADLEAGQELLIQNEVPVLTATNRTIVSEFKKDGITVNSGYGLLEPDAHNCYVIEGYVDAGYVGCEAGYVESGYVDPGYVD